MNDLMSFGLHHMWKDMLVNQLPLHSGHTYKILDMAAGTGDISARLTERSKHHDFKLHLTACDASKEMIEKGKQRYSDAPWQWRCEDARSLSFKKDTIDAYLISFGLRNVLPFYDGLKEAYRVLKPGGFFYCLEFSHPTSPWWEVLYQLHGKVTIPLMAKIVAKDSAPYHYLIESIERFPKLICSKVLLKMRV